MKAKYYILSVLCLIVNVSFSQDFHISQFDANPLNLNPALTGERLSDLKGIQFNCNYRDQLANYSNGPGSYKTIAAGLDFSVNSKLSLGQYFGNNKSSDGSFSSSNFIFSSSYKIIDKSVDSKEKFNLSVGLQAGILNASFDPKNYTYGNQYSATSADGFDRTIPSGENYNKTSIYKLNVNFGLYGRAKLMNDQLTVFGGFSMFNVNRPNASFYGMKSQLPIRFNLHGGGIYKVDEKLSIMTQILYMNQAKANELNMSAFLLYKVNNEYEPLLGLGWRNKNAVIVHAGMKVKNNTFRASYCFVNSYLADFRNRGLEFSFIHVQAKKQKDRTKVVN